MIQKDMMVVIDNPDSGNHGRLMAVLEVFEDARFGELARCTWSHGGVEMTHEYTTAILRPVLS